MFGVRQRSVARHGIPDVIKEIRWQHFQIDPSMINKQIYQIVIARRYASTIYILCDSPLLVRLSVLGDAEGPRDGKSCRGTRVAT